MGFDIDKHIGSVRKAYECKKEAEVRFLKASLPPFNDTGRIGEIFDSVVSENKGSDRSEQINVFMFIVICLYSPRTLTGGNLARGLRKVLADTIGVKCDPIVSRAKSISVFYYQNNRKFRSKVLSTYDKICKRLGYLPH